MRGSSFPGRRVSTHRHTCLRKASSARTLARLCISFQVSSQHPSSSLPRRLSLLRCAFLRVRRCASSCRHVHTYLVTDRKSPDLSSLREKLQMCESTLRTQLKRVEQTHVDKCVRNWNFYISSLSLFLFCSCFLLLYIRKIDLIIK